MRGSARIGLSSVLFFFFFKEAATTDTHPSIFVGSVRGVKETAPAMIWSAVATKVLATLLVAFGLGLITPISWPLIGLVWAYAIAWVFVEDGAKLAVYRHLGHTSRRHQAFLTRLQETLHLGA